MSLDALPKSAEAALQRTAGGRSEERLFRVMADSCSVLMWLAGPDGGCIFFNAGWLTFTGRTMEQELGDGWSEGVHPDDLDRCITIYRSHLAQRRSFEMDYRLRRNDGEYRWVFDQGTPLTLPDGRFGGFIGSCVDVTDRRRMEQERLEQVTERERIGRELHETLVKRLFSINLSLQIACELVRDHPDAGQRLQSAVHELDEMIVEVRRTVFGLRGSKARTSS
jgi:PAS domain S-box-containing protein